MQIRYVIIKVDDQDKALFFYTSILGFVKKQDLPIGRVRWLTVISPEGAPGVELVLEPNTFPAALASQKTLFDAGFPAAVLSSTDITAEYQRLKSLRVTFRGEPKNMGPVTAVPFEDTCGNLIMLVQPAA